MPVLRIGTECFIILLALFSFLTNCPRVLKICAVKSFVSFQKHNATNVQPHSKINPGQKFFTGLLKIFYLKILRKNIRSWTKHRVIEKLTRGWTKRRVIKRLTRGWIISTAIQYC